MDGDKACSKSMDLINYIGLDGKRKAPSTRLSNEEFAAFLELSKLNKIPLMFLNASPLDNLIKPIVATYEQRYENTLSLIAYTADLLERKKMGYALFKTLKPFP